MFDVFDDMKKGKYVRNIVTTKQPKHLKVDGPLTPKGKWITESACSVNFMRCRMILLQDSQRNIMLKSLICLTLCVVYLLIITEK